MKNPIKRLSRGGRIAVSLGVAAAIGLSAGIPAAMVGGPAPMPPGITNIGYPPNLPVVKPIPVKPVPIKPVPPKPIASRPVSPAPVKSVPGPAPVRTKPTPVVHVAYYTVRSGDVLSVIAHNYGVSVQTILNANKFIKNANAIEIGWKLTIPGGHWVGPAPVRTKPTPPAGYYSGNLSQSQLASLWIYCGGNPAYAHIASAVAMAESGGRQYAYNGNGGRSTDRGYWQINSCHGSLSTFDPVGNAKAAISISNNGRNWMPWVAYWNGSYRAFM